MQHVCRAFPHPPAVQGSLGSSLSLSLLLDVVLSTALLGFSLCTHLIIVSLATLIASQTSDRAANSALCPVGNAAAKIVQLALGLLLLSFEILLTTRGFEGLA